MSASCTILGARLHQTFERRARAGRPGTHRAGAAQRGVARSAALRLVLAALAALGALGVFGLGATSVGDRRALAEG